MEQSVTTTSNGLSIQHIIFPTKKEILQRLFTEQKITFDEMWVLMQEAVEVRYVNVPQQVFPLPDPFVNPQLPWTTCSTNNQQNGDNNK